MKDGGSGGKTDKTPRRFLISSRYVFAMNEPVLAYSCDVFSTGLTMPHSAKTNPVGGMFGIIAGMRLLMQEGE